LESSPRPMKRLSTTRVCLPRLCSPRAANLLVKHSLFLALCFRYTNRAGYVKMKRSLREMEMWRKCMRKTQAITTPMINKLLKLKFKPALAPKFGKMLSPF